MDTIESGAFNDLIQLQELVLGDNYIGSITAGSLDGMPSLQKLWLYSNDIDTIEQNSFLQLGSLEVFMESHSEHRQ